MRYNCIKRKSQRVVGMGFRTMATSERVAGMRWGRDPYILSVCT